MRQAVLIFLLLALPCCRSRPQRVIIGIALTASNHPAVVQAVKEINDGGGIDGVRLELVGLDWIVDSDYFHPEEIVTWADRFAENKDLVAVIGHSDSSSTLSAAAVYNARQVPQIVTIATNPAITNIGGWTYRLCLSDAVQGAALARYCVSDWGKKSMCVFYVNDAYGRGLDEVFETEARALGAKILATRMHRNILQDDDKEMMGATLANLKKGAEPDVFVLFQRVAAAKWTIETIRRMGFRANILGGDNLERLEPPASNNKGFLDMRVAQFYLPSPDDQLATKFAESFRASTGAVPDYGQAFAYDAVYLVRDALLRNGCTREGVKNYLDYLIREKVVVSGVAGSYVLGPDHDARRVMYIVPAGNEQHAGVKTLTPN